MTGGGRHGTGRRGTGRRGGLARGAARQRTRRGAGRRRGGRRGRGRRRRCTDALNERLLEAVNATGEVFLSHTRLHGRFAIRLAVGHVRTEERHVRRAWDLFNEKLRAFQESAP